MEDSDELWERIVNRTFPKCEIADDETWRECYYVSFYFILLFGISVHENSFVKNIIIQIGRTFH